MAELEEVFAKTPNAKGKIVEGKAVIINLDKGSYYQLNEVASTVWQLIDGKTSLEKIVGDLAKEFDASKNELEKDLLELVADLKKEGLVELC